jgi:hypothetical protein
MNKIAVATEPLPGGFVSVSPVPGSSASSVAPMDELFFGALLSHFPRLSTSHFPRLSTSHFPRLSTLSGAQFLTLLRLGGSLWWTYQVFFFFLTRLQVPSHKLLWSFVDCLSVLPTLWRQFVQCKSNFYCSLPSEQCPDAVQRRFRFDLSALSGSSLGAVSIFFGAKFFFFR